MLNQYFLRNSQELRNMVYPMTISDSLRHTTHVRPSHKKSSSHVTTASAQSSLLSKAPRLCEKSPKAVVDIVMFFLVVGACGLLFTPYFKFLFMGVVEVVPLALIYIGEVVYQAPVAYISGAIIMFVLVIGGLELYEYKTRKCDNPKCKGLKKSVEFDIQLESEGCVKSLSSFESSSSVSPSDMSSDVPWRGSVELGHGHKELEAKLKKMAPPNGRAVLVFRYPCGCPAAHMAVEGAKKPRRSKK